MKIILFNGPPRSGKDTGADLVAKWLSEDGHKVLRYRMAEPLKNAIHSLFGFHGVNVEHFNMTKSEPNYTMFGMTPREAYIWLSEQCVKPKFGKDAFARIATNIFENAEIDNYNFVVVSDTGFQEEIDTIIKVFGKDNVLLVQMHRQGMTFNGDSRGYVMHPGANNVAVVNNSDIQNLQRTLALHIRQFLNIEESHHG